MSVNTTKFTHDPTIAMWLFITLTQVQVMLALLSAAFPGLKKTLQDLVTRHGAESGSHSSNKHKGSYALDKLRSSATRSAKPSRLSKSKMDAENTGDGDSQDGIIRQDEFEIRYSEPSDREAEGQHRRW